MSNSNNDLETTAIEANPAPRKRGRPRKTEAEKLEARQNKIEERLQKALEKKAQRQSTIESPFKHTHTILSNADSSTGSNLNNSDIHQRTKHTIDNLVHTHSNNSTTPIETKPKLTLRFKDGRSISASNRTEATTSLASTNLDTPNSASTLATTTVTEASPLPVSSTDLETLEAAPRKRGRPRKIRPENEPPKPKGRPGRPRKVRPEEIKSDESTTTSSSTESGAKKAVSFASSHDSSPMYLTKEHFEKPKPKPVKDILDLDDDDEDIDDIDLINNLDDNDDEDFIDDDLSEFIDDKNDLKNQQLQSINVEKIIVPFNPRRFTRIETSINQKTYSSTSSSLEAIGIKPYVFEGEEEYMNDRQLKHIRSILLTQRATLIKQLEETKEVMRENNENYADELDQASVESDYAISLRIRDRERKLTLKIDRALARLNNDPDFGYCEKCGEEIGLRRLEARPTADLCINCKTKAEIHERQQKG